ncbi:MAG: beta-ketoacyl-[acyl-carrier-protein] synthase family protein [Nitrospirae bacterium]|nr:beta-ketoacyl-[acyl-carrier-protein] synthase family protein [Nitrospirota bacterium]
MTGVWVTAMGLVAPLRPFDTIDAFWGALTSGEDSIKLQAPPLLNEKKEWLTASIETGQALRPEDKFFYIAEAALKMAIGDSGLSAGKLQGADLIIGSILGNVLSRERQLIDGNIQHRTAEASLSYPVRYLGQRFAIGGRLSAISTACASGTDAVGIAARSIATGEAEVVIAGGIDVLSDFALAGFNLLQALTEDKVRPFDKKRTGLALGEGAAFLVLEAERHALARGAKCYGRVLGYASRADASHLTAPHREGRGLASAITAALSQSGLRQYDINYINAHGTATVYNDLMETKAIKLALGEAAYTTYVSSTKSMLGHAFGASGVIEALCALMAINTGVIPPTINYRYPDPQCDLNYVPNTAKATPVGAAMSLSAGFGGQNAAVIFGRPPQI